MLTLSNNNFFGYNEFSGSSDLYPLLNKNLHNPSDHLPLVIDVEFNGT